MWAPIPREIELGDAAQGERNLSTAGGVLATYHLARLAARRGDVARARSLLASIDGGDDEKLLGDVGLAMLGLQAKPPDLAGAKAVVERRPPRKLPPWLDSELLLLDVRVAMSEGRKGDASVAAMSLGMPPDAHDPSAMLRATGLVGPLRKLVSAPAR